MTAASRSSPGPGRSFYVPAFLWLVIVGLLVVGLLWIFIPNWGRARSDLRPNASDVLATFPILAFATVGALIAWRQHRNRIGWLLIGTASAAILLSLPKLYAGLAMDLGWSWLPAPLWIYWIGQYSWLVVVELFLVLLPLYYPDGRLPGPRWRLVLWSSLLLVLIALITSLDPSVASAGLPNPLSVKALAGTAKAVALPLPILFLATALAAVFSLVVRYRHGNHRDRQQLKWLMVAAGLLLVSFVVSFTLPVGQYGYLLPLAAAALPIAIGIAILRYRLYDIDVIINKALVYGGLAAVITAVYVLVVINIGALVGGSQRLWLSLVTTAVIALAFQPLRDRGQRMANRLVYGKRATPYEALSQFSEHLSATYSHEDILERMARILAQGTGAERAEVWVRAGQRLVLASSSPQAPEPVTPLVMQNGAQDAARHCRPGQPRGGAPRRARGQQEAWRDHEHRRTEAGY